MLKNIKLKLKKLIGKIYGHWCQYCGAEMEGYGWNFLQRCSDPDCLSHPEARERFDIRPVTKEAKKHMKEVDDSVVVKIEHLSEPKKKRGRPRKS